jgi:hypothetical protein
MEISGRSSDRFRQRKWKTIQIQHNHRTKIQLTTMTLHVPLQSYPAVTDFLRSGLFHRAGDANSFAGDAYIKLVCSPNNPDGAIRDSIH